SKRDWSSDVCSSDLAVFTTTEPVDQEDLRQQVAALIAHVDPVLQVVTGVVADERQHSHGVMAQGADLCFCRCRGLTRCQQGANHRAVLPVEGLGHEWHGAGATAAEQDGVELNALPVIKFWGCSWALG